MANRKTVTHYKNELNNQQAKDLLYPNLPTQTPEEALDSIEIPKSLLQKLLSGLGNVATGVGNAAKGAWNYYQGDHPGLQRFLADAGIAAAGPYQDMFGAQLGRAVKGYAAGRQQSRLMSGQPLTGFDSYGLTPEELKVVRDAQFQQQEVALKGREVATGEGRLGVEQEKLGIDKALLPTQQTLYGAQAGAYMPWGNEEALRMYEADARMKAAGSSAGSDTYTTVQDMGEGMQGIITVDKGTGRPINVVPIGTPVGAKVTEPERQASIGSLTDSLYKSAGYGGGFKHALGGGPDKPDEMIREFETGKLAAKLQSLVDAGVIDLGTAEYTLGEAGRLYHLMKRYTTSYPPQMKLPLSGSAKETVDSRETATPKKKETGISDLLK